MTKDEANPGTAKYIIPFPLLFFLIMTIVMNIYGTLDYTLSVGPSTLYDYLLSFLERIGVRGKFLSDYESDLLNCQFLKGRHYVHSSQLSAGRRVGVQ